MKRFAIIITLILTVLMLVSCSDRTNLSLYSFKSKQEIINLLDQRSGFKLFDYDSFPLPTAPGDSISTESKDYSTTNTQEKNIDEGDIIKTDGTNIYFLSTSGLRIIGVNNGDLSLLCSEDYQNYTPYEMYIYEDKLIVIGGIYKEVVMSPYYTGMTLDCCMWYYMVEVSVRTYSFNGANLKLEHELLVSGFYNTSRFVNGKLYYFVYDYAKMVDQELSLPYIKVNNEDKKEIDISKVFYLKSLGNYSSLISIFGYIDINTFELEYKGVFSSYSEIYFTDSYIYFIFAKWDYSGLFFIQEYQVDSIIVRVNNADLSFDKGILIDGYIKDRYSLSEYNGFLRIVSTISSSAIPRNTILTILNSQFKKVSEIRDIAPGETVFSVKFLGDKGTIVTFLQIDPLFTLDLSDPYHPTISQGLKEEGVSMYLHYIEGTHYLIGVGYSAGFRGVKVTLYDIQGDDAVIINTISFDGYSYSQLLYNPKALVYSLERNIFAFCIETWDYSIDHYTLKQGLVVFRILEGELVNTAILTDIDLNTDYNNFYYFSIQRGVQIGNCIYTISNTFVSSYSLNDFSLIDKLQISNP